MADAPLPKSSEDYAAAHALEYKNRGNAKFKERDYEGAVQAFSAAIALDPSNAVLYSNRSGALAAWPLWQENLPGIDAPARPWRAPGHPRGPAKRRDSRENRYPSVVLPAHEESELEAEAHQLPLRHRERLREEAERLRPRRRRRRVVVGRHGGGGSRQIRDV